MYLAIYVIVVFAGLAMTVREGLWSNTITLVNVLVSGLIAFAFYAPLTTWVDVQLDGEWTYVLDFVLVWALFVISTVLLRALTRAASRSRMRFRHPIDPVGGPIMGFAAAWVLSAFVMATLHMVPMPGKDAFGGKLAYNDAELEGKSSLTAPDLGWLRFVQRVSAASSYGSASTDQFWATEFIHYYQDHREKLGKATAPWLRVKRG